MSDEKIVLLSHFEDAVNQIKSHVSTTIATAVKEAVPERVYHFLTSGSSIVLPTGLYKITVVGGGAGGGGAANNTPCPGSGAGATAIWIGTLEEDTYSYTVGTAGTAFGNANGITANAGTASVFNFAAGSNITAGGGNYPSARTANAAGGSGGTVTSSSLPAGGQLIPINGQAGGVGSSATAANRGGMGGSTLYGVGGHGGVNNAANTATAGIGYGAGGGGASGAQNGGAGAPGCIIIESI
jgi:hypothetical protein